MVDRQHRPGVGSIGDENVDSTGIAAEPFPLSVAQLGIWYAQHRNPDVPIVISHYLELVGEIDPGVLESAGRRAAFEIVSPLVRIVEVGGMPHQLVDSSIDISLDVIDLRDADDPMRAAQALMAERSSARVNLTEPPLATAALLRLGDDHYYCYARAHHIVLDGWGAMNLLRRTGELYTAEVEGRSAPSATFSDLETLVEAERKYREDPRFERDRAYWTERITGIAGMTSLSRRRSAPSADKIVAVGEVAGGVLAGLDAMANRHASVRSVAVIAAFASFLARMTDQVDVVLSLPVAARITARTRRSGGMVSNILPIRLRIDADTTVGGLLDQVRLAIAGALRHQLYRHEDIRRDQGMADGGSFGPQVNVMLYQGGVAMGAARGDLHILSTGAVEDLAVNIYQDVDRAGLKVDFEADPGRYSVDDVRRWRGRFTDYLIAFTETESTDRLGTVRTLSATERAQLTVAVNETAYPVPVGVTLVSLFADRVVRSPAGVAVVDGVSGAVLSYGEFAGRVYRLARVLIDAGVGPEVLVGLGMRRSVELVVGMYAVVVAGGGFVPVDPDHPVERTEFVLDAAGVRLVLAVRRDEWTVPGAGMGRRVVWLDELDLSAGSGAPVTDGERRAPVRPGNAAYVLFTSGSTGRPKGVLVSHAAIVNQVVWLADEVGLNAGDVWLQKAPHTFDMSLWGYLVPMLAGASSVIARPDGQHDVPYLARLISENGITIADFVPSALDTFAAIADSAALSSLRTVLVGAEVLSIRTATRVGDALPEATLYNLYGPTEAAVAVTAHAVNRASWSDDSVPIGLPVSNTRTYVLDSRLRVVPAGVVGELYVAGGQLARGYLGSAAPAAARFVADPFDVAGGRMYRTGDFVLWNPTGELVYLKRGDFQVKLRGRRIEPAEIEEVLRAAPGVGAAVVTVFEGTTGQRLVGYLVADVAARVEVGAVRELASRRLPGHMVPSAFVVLDELPVGASGKVDRAALPAPTFEARSYRAPVTPVERRVAGAFAEVLRLDRVGLDDDFFALGGDSLLATQAAARLGTASNAVVPVRVLFEFPVVAGLAAWLTESMGAGARPALARWARPERLPLSPAQSRMWFLNRLDPGSARYNIPLVLRLSGDLDVAALASAIDDVVVRHEVLRTVYPEFDGVGYQQVLTPTVAGVLLGPPIPLEADNVDAAVHNFVGAGFDVTRDVPVRMRLWRVTDRGSAEFVLAVVSQHVAADGFSLRPLARDVMAAYTARLHGAAPGWAPLDVQYADYTLWHRAVLGAENDPGSLASRQIDYWREQLAGAPEEMRLPTDRPRAAFGSGRAGLYRTRLDTETVRRIGDFARPRRVTSFMVLHAAFAVLLARLSGESDVVIGTPVAGRGESALDDLVGMFVGMSVLRTPVDPASGFGDFVERVREIDLAAFAHADVPFERLVEVLDPPRSAGRHPLFQVMLAFQNVGETRFELPGLSVSAVEVDPTTTVKFDLQITMAPEPVAGVGLGAGDQGWSVEWGFAQDLFDLSTIQDFARRFERVLDVLLTEPSVRLDAVRLLSPAESAWFAVGVNETARVVSPEVTLASLLADRADRSSDSVAMIFAGRSMTYAELDVRVSRLARGLIDIGVGPESTVAIAMSRSIEFVVAAYAVLRAGGGYLPLDPAQPVERISYLLAAADPSVVLTAGGDIAGTAGRVVRDVTAWELSGLSDAAVTDEDRLAPLRPENTAYVIFTSGSTGRPKGVVVPHAAIVNQLFWLVDRFGLSQVDVWLQKTAFTFDLSVWGLFAPLLVGATTVIAPPGAERDPDQLSELINEHRVTIADFVPSLLGAFVEHLDSDRLPTLRTVLAIGEELPARTAGACSAMLPGVELYNLYGPTEAAVDVTFHAVTGADTRASDRGGSVPIGLPVWNTRVFVLDDRLGLVPVGVAGELYLAGVQLARGYVGRPGSTAERFVADPFDPGGAGRLYRTGDVVRWNPTGELVFVGRRDSQVKLRGLRIELGEIEAVLAGAPGVGQAVVAVVAGELGRRLVGYVVAADPDAGVDIELVRMAVAKILPGYMVPSAWLVMDAVPTNANGKVDRRALPAPDVRARVYRAPMTPTEHVVAGVFGAVLGVGPVGLDDDFFGLGGNSLVATRVAARLGAALDTTVPVQMLFEVSSVAAVAARLASDTGGGRVALARREWSGRVPLAPAQSRMWLFNQLDPTSAAYNIPLVVRLAGAVDEAALRVAIADVIVRHEALRTVYPEYGGVGFQEVLKPEHTGIELDVVAGVGEAELTARVAEFVSGGFDVTARVPLRARLWRLGGAVVGTEWVLGVVVHHIAADGFSLAPLARDLMTAYAARVSGMPPRWPLLRVRYADYALWHREVLGDEADPDSLIATQLEFWRERLADLPGELALPTDRPRPAVASGRGGLVRTRWDAPLVSGIHRCAREWGVTPFMVVHAALAVLLARLSGESDVVVGTPVAGRGEAALDDMVGMFVNTLVLRTEVAPGMSFAELVAQVRALDVAAFGHADVPFERLVEVLDPPRCRARHPFFQVMLAFQNLDDVAFAVPGLTVTTVDPGVFTATFDLQLTVLHESAFGRGSGGTGWSVEWAFARDLFDETTVAVFARRFTRILTGVVPGADPNVAVGDLDIRIETEPEDTEILAGPVTGDEPQLLADVLAAAVTLDPAHPALVDSGRSLTYAELDTATSRLARVLIRRGAGAESFVAVRIPRSIEYVVAVWAVVKSGAAFVPVDPRHPVDRVGYLVVDSGAFLGLSVVGMADRLPDVLAWLLVDSAELLAAPAEPVPAADRPGPVGPDNCAYVCYTSGSTGKPKGVLVTHRGIGNFVADQRSLFGANSAARVLQLASPGFDVSLLDQLLAIAGGATMVICPPDISGGADLAELIRRERISHAFVTPSVLASMSPAGLVELRTLIVGGEACSAEVVSAWSPGRDLINGYGPTETTILSLTSRPLRSGEPIPIGVPMRGVTAYVLDSRLGHCPIGTVGELYSAGPGLARGYRHAPGATASRFVADPYGAPGARMYRTGDLVRRVVVDGRVDIVYLGRRDFQVKVRGQRIELGEIDAVLAEHDAVGFAAAAVHRTDSGEVCLVGYVRAVPGETIDTADLKRFAARALPTYMVPASIVVLERIPLTVNGKLDRAALPAPVFRPRNFRPAATPVEQTIAVVFADVLGVPQVGADDDFFELGGSSLTAARVVARLADALEPGVSLHDLFEAATVADLATRLAGVVESGALDAVPRPALTARVRPTRVPLSPAQARMWFLNRWNPNSATYNIPMVVRISGVLDEGALRSAIEDVVSRHEALRTVYPEHDGVGWQQVLEPTAAAIGLTRGGDVAESALIRLVTDYVAVGFEVTRQVPVRARMWSVRDSAEPAATWVLALVVHHIAADGLSVAPLARDIFAAYGSRTAGAEPGWAPLPVQYADYTLWQREVLGDEEDPISLVATQLRYWRNQLAGIPDELGLPTDRPRPPVASGRGNTVPVRLTSAQTNGLAGVARRAGVTRFMTMHAVLAVLAARLSGQPDVSIGAPVSGRGEPVLTNLVGMFVNTLVLRTRIDPGMSFVELLAVVRATDLAALGNADVPFERLVELVDPARSRARHPLFQVALFFEDRELFEDREFFRNQAASGPPGFDLAEITIDPGVSRFDLQLTIREPVGSDGASAGLVGGLGYATELFDEATVSGFVEQLVRIVDAVVVDPDVAVGAIDLLGTRGRELLLHRWNDTERAVSTRLLLDGFDTQVATRPDAVAVVFAGQQLTYRELAERVNRTARLLRTVVVGVGPEALVAVLPRRSIELVVAIYAVLRAGGGFVPIDPDQPESRIRLLLATTRPTCVLYSGRDDLATLANCPVLALDRMDVAEFAATPVTDADRPTSLRPRHLAYVFFTSGSTGAPKGVAVSHAAVVNQLAWLIDRYRLDGTDVWLLKTAPTFDVSLWGLFAPLQVGGRLVVTDPDGHRDVAYLGRQIDRHRVTVTDFVPSMLAIFAAYVDVRELDSLKTIFVIGEELPTSTARAFRGVLPDVALHNLYGPTEAAVSITHRQALPTDPDGSVPIGSPVWNSSVYVLDSRLEPVPVGTVGELYLGGVQLARGYLAAPGRTAERFVAHPFDPAGGSRLYRTGDLVSWSRAGELTYSGRTDFQVKFRGQRIEPAEIEAVLAAAAGVLSVSVQLVATRSGEQLVAYLRRAPGAVVEPDRVRASAAERLPDHLVPTAFVVLDDFPVNSAGKLDRRALPVPQPRARPYLAPVTPTERAVAAAFADVLGIDRVGVDDDFFELGGHSLLIVRLVDRLRRVGGTELGVSELFVHSSVEDLARLIDTGEPRRTLGSFTDDAVLAADITAAGRAAAAGAIANVLLTGATGLLGAHLLGELLDRTTARIWCLVRADSVPHARARIEEALIRYVDRRSHDLDRIIPVPGDLAADRLGLTAAEFARLAGGVDTVVHNGARVNHVEPYRRLRRPNVVATEWLLRLATTRRVKPFHFVSTISVLTDTAPDAATVATEDDRLPADRVSESGYVRSKWVAEELVHAAAARGVPASIYRPGLIGGDVVSGAGGTDDAFWNLVRATVTLGRWPDVAVGSVPMVPVNYVASALVALVSFPGGGTFHLVGAAPVEMTRVAGQLRAHGYRLRPVPATEFAAALFEAAERLTAAGDDSLARAALVAAGFATGRDDVVDAVRRTVDDRRTRAALAGSGVVPTEIDEATLRRYIAYYTRVGFLRQ